MRMTLGSASRPGDGHSDDQPDDGGWAYVADERTIDDRCSYGDPHSVDKPDFVKEEERGWTFFGSLARLLGD